MFRDLFLQGHSAVWRPALKVAAGLVLLTLCGCIPVGKSLIERSDVIGNLREGYVVATAVGSDQPAVEASAIHFATDANDFMKVELSDLGWRFTVGFKEIAENVYYTEFTMGDDEKHFGMFVDKHDSMARLRGFAVGERGAKSTDMLAELQQRYKHLAEKESFTLDEVKAYYDLLESSVTDDQPYFQLQLFPEHEKERALAAVDAINAANGFATRAQKHELEVKKQAEEKAREQQKADAEKTKAAETARRNANACLSLAYNQIGEMIFVNNTCDEKLTINVCLKTKGDTAMDMFKSLVGADNVFGQKQESWSCSDYVKGKGQVTKFNWSNPGSMNVVKLLANEAYQITATRR